MTSSRDPYRQYPQSVSGGAIFDKHQTCSPLAAAARSRASALADSRSCAQDDVEKQFGIVHFETSCNETAQRRFDRAMRYQHSFWYQSSKEIFEETLKADPECAIAYWGIALSLLWNPHVPTPAKNLAEGAAAIEKGKSVGAKSQRERDFIDALAVMYADHDKIPHGARVQAYLKAMEALAARYPNDDEAQIFYGITLNVAASPNDKTYANQLKGAAILEPIFKRQPRHPGVAHYLIHLYDTPALADKGLEAARLYAGIAPAPPTRSTCRRTSSRASVTGRNRSTPTGKRSASRNRQRLPRPAARYGLSGLCVSAARAGPSRQGRARRDDDDRRIHRNVPAWPVCAGRVAGALCGRTGGLEGGGGSLRSVRARCRTCRR